ncbi:MAG: radical SAM protein [Oligoflexia bacterium]|nr:radical SAM protein [Oligoflexia bacterium]
MDISRLSVTSHKLFHHIGEVTKWQKGEDFMPIVVEVNPIDGCNHRCVFCYSDFLGHHKELMIDPDLLVRVFRDMGKCGVKSVMLQGTGEPLMNPGTPDAIVAGKEAGLDIALITNGVLFNEESLEKIIPRLSYLRCSALESTPELYAKTHRSSPKHHEKILNNLKRAVEIRNRELAKNPNLETIIQVHHIPFPYNIHQTVDTVKMMRDIGLDMVYVKPAQIRPDNKDHEWPLDMHLKYKEVLEECTKLETSTFKVSVRWNEFELCEVSGPFKKGYNSCFGMYFSTNIDADSKVYPCYKHWREPEWCLGDLKEMSFEEIWKSDRRKQLLADHMKNYDLNQCHVQCRQHPYNKALWDLEHPPLHKNFL